MLRRFLLKCEDSMAFEIVWQARSRTEQGVYGFDSRSVVLWFKSALIITGTIVFSVERKVFQGVQDVRRRGSPWNTRSFAHSSWYLDASRMQEKSKPNPSTDGIRTVNIKQYYIDHRYIDHLCKVNGKCIQRQHFDMFTLHLALLFLPLMHACWL